MSTPSVIQRWPVLLYATTWTTLLTVTVAVASLSPELAFVAAISWSRGCGGEGYIRVPLDMPGEIMCLPSQMFKRSNIDLLVAPIFAALVVAASACVVRSLALWEDDDVLS